MVSEFMGRLVWREIVPSLKLPASLHLKVWMVGIQSFLVWWLSFNQILKKYARQNGNHLPQFSGVKKNKYLSCHHLGIPGSVLGRASIRLLPSHLGFGLGSLGTLGTAPSTLGTAGTAPSPVQDGSPGVDVGRNYLI